MTPEAVLNELKEKRLPTYGTAQEKRDRLKKQYGIAPPTKKSNMSQPNTVAHSNSVVEIS